MRQAMRHMRVVEHLDEGGSLTFKSVASKRRAIVTKRGFCYHTARYVGTVNVHGQEFIDERDAINNAHRWA